MRNNAPRSRTKENTAKRQNAPRHEGGGELSKGRRASIAWQNVAGILFSITCGILRGATAAVAASAGEWRVGCLFLAILMKEEAGLLDTATYRLAPGSNAHPVEGYFCPSPRTAPSSNRAARFFCCYLTRMRGGTRRKAREASSQCPAVNKPSGCPTNTFIAVSRGRTLIVRLARLWRRTTAY